MKKQTRQRIESAKETLEAAYNDLYVIASLYEDDLRDFTTAGASEGTVLLCEKKLSKVQDQMAFLDTALSAIDKLLKTK